MSSTEEAIKDLHTILSDYIRDTGVYVKPLLADKAMGINRNMIWWNLGQIDKVVAHTFSFRERRQNDLVPFYLSGEEKDEWKEKTEHNYQLVENFRVNRLLPAREKLLEHMETLWSLYNKKVKPFENEDDVYKAKADALYGKYSDLRERLSDGFEDSVQKNRSELTGFGTAMKDIVGGLLVGTVENVVFMGATQVYLHSKPFGVTPDWVSGFVENQVTKKVDSLAGMRDLLMDPTILADGMVKGVSDVYEDEGIAYCIGYVKGTVVSNYLTSSGVNALVEASVPKVKYTADDLKQLAEYERFLEHGSTAGLTPEELAGLEKVDAQLALKNVDYDDLLELRKSIGEGAGEASTWKMTPELEKHLLESQGFVRKGGKGIVGGHNMDEFYNALKMEGFNIEDCIIEVKPHPTVEGIYEIKYQIPVMQYNSDGMLEAVTGQFKKISTPKTVFDPIIIPNEEMVVLSNEALNSTTMIGDRIIEGTASNGLKFRGYVDLTTEEITSFFPTLFD